MSGKYVIKSKTSAGLTSLPQYTNHNSKTDEANSKQGSTHIPAFLKNPSTNASKATIQNHHSDGLEIRVYNS